MSNIVELITADVYSTRDAFGAAVADRSLSFDREAGFAVQILCANEYMMTVAKDNRQSVVDAVTNVAAIGLSLNPAKKLAYLVPRKKKICLDISYIGLIELATSTGSVKWAQSEIVYSNDSFSLTGLDRPPEHKFNPFSTDRGEAIGAYVVVKTADGDFLTETMSTAEINKIRDASESVKSGKGSPWDNFWGEMAKKTVIKRAYKLWPKNDRLDNAIQYLNTDGEEGILPSKPIETLAHFDRVGWIEKANKAETLEALAGIWKDGTKAATDAKDRDGYALFKAAASAKRTTLEQPIAVTA